MEILKNVLFLALSTTTLVVNVFAQPYQDFVSKPVGQVKLTVSGTGGAGTSAISVLGVPLENPVDAEGILTGVAANTLTDSSASWTPDAFANTHYVQITSGTYVGISATITGNTATELTTAGDISSLLIGDEPFEIRAYTTLADVFGAANEAGLDGGTSAALADEVLIYNGVGFDIYYYQQGAAFGGDGWRNAVNAFDDQSGISLPIGASIILKRKQVVDLDIIVDGSVLTTDAIIPVEGGVNWISSAHIIEHTLASYFGVDGGSLLKGATASAADEILVPNGNGGFNIYYYQEGASGGDGYRSSTDLSTDASAAVIAAVGKGFVLKRKGTGTSYNQTDRTPLSQ